MLRIIMLSLALSAAAAAQDAAPAPAPVVPPAAPDAAAPQNADAAAFAAVDQQWNDLIAQVRSIQQKFPSTPAEQRPALIDEFNATVAKLREMSPQRREAAVAAYQAAPNADGKVSLALLQMLEADIAQDRYDAAAELGDLLVKNQMPNARVYDLAGRAAFARSEFDKAEAHWKKARDVGTDLSRESQTYANMVGDYKQWWQAEQAKRGAEAKADNLPRVKIATTAGDVTIELFENEAPNTVANFIHLVEKGFYDGTVFHRVLPNFMAQGGDPTGTGSGGPGWAIACEHDDRPDFRRHFRGTLSMAHAGKDTGGSQFFLTFLPTPHLDGRHTAFGRVIEGMDVLAEIQRIDPGEQIEPTRIKSAKVVRKRDHAYEPKKLPSRR